MPAPFWEEFYGPPTEEEIRQHARLEERRDRAAPCIRCGGRKLNPAAPYCGFECGIAYENEHPGEDVPR